MDRKLIVTSKKGYLQAELIFRYEGRNDARCSVIEYSNYETDDGYSVFALSPMDGYAQYKKFKSIDEIKAYDIALAKDKVQEVRANPNDFTYTYDTEDVIYRYFLKTHIDVIGMAQIRSNFLKNYKELEFFSAKAFVHDETISSNSLEGNYDLVKSIRDQRVGYSDMQGVIDWDRDS